MQALKNAAIENNCKHCKYFNFIEEDGDNPEGECRRFPPSVTFFDDERMRTYFPEVQYIDWCGEFSLDIKYEKQYIRDTGMSTRTKNCLMAENIMTVGELIKIDAIKLREIPLCGPATIKEIHEFLLSKKQADVD
jgi:hypothetical protein